MSLTQALASAVSGLHVSQAGLAIVAANVANAETPGYVRKNAVQVTTAAGELGIGVRIAAINRELDQYVQRQLRVETSGAAYADLRAQFYQRIQSIYGVPGSDGTLESVYNDFLGATQTLATSPESQSARSAVLNAAQVLAQQLNSMSSEIQALRSDAELGLADSVDRANEAMQRIAQINQQLGSSGTNDAGSAVLQDQRDYYIDQLAQLMDIRVVATDHNQVNVFTSSGVQLVGTQAAKLTFDAQGTVTPAAQWSSDPAERGVGTIKLASPNGGTIDLVAGKTFRSGQIATYLEMRDQLLVEAQSQLDQIAAALASALSDRSVDGAAVTVGPQDGFDVDIGNLLAGNSVRLTYTDTATGTTRTYTLMRVDDPGALPLDDTATADPNDKVIGIDFSGGMASIVAQLNAAFSVSGLQFSNPAGTTLRALDDGVSNFVNIDALSTIYTESSLTGGSSELPFFVDANTPYTGAITSSGPQSLGLAGRISVNLALLNDPSRLVVYETSPPTESGDYTRPAFIYDRLTSGAMTFSPSSGIGAESSPFTGTLSSFMRLVISNQGEAAEAAESLKAGQDVVLSSLQQRFNDNASVNIDAEMANLLSLQTSYAANARVLTAVREMLDELLRL